MLFRLAVVFFVIAIISALLGFGGIAESAASLAVGIFYVFVVLFLLALIFGAIFRR